MSHLKDSLLYVPSLEDNYTQNVSMKSVCLLLFTIILEITGTILLKCAVKEKMYIIGAYIMYFIGLSIFSYVLHEIPLSIAYTTWCSLGTVGVSIMSQIVFAEDISFSKWMCIVGTVPCLAGIYIL